MKDTISILFGAIGLGQIVPEAAAGVETIHWMQIIGAVCGGIALIIQATIKWQAAKVKELKAENAELKEEIKRLM